MKFTEIFNRLTGISTPFGGVSWDASESTTAVARRVITFLEDRRVLYSPSQLELPEHCVQSILEIRRFLTKELGHLSANTVLTDSLRAMRAACRKVLNQIGADDRRDIVSYATMRNHWASWTFYSAIGELRGIFGIHLAQIAAHYKLDIEDGLASILPAADDPGES